MRGLHVREQEALADALAAFWDVVADRFPEAEAGDLDPETVIEFDTVACRAMWEWIDYNVPYNVRYPE